MGCKSSKHVAVHPYTASRKLSSDAGPADASDIISPTVMVNTSAIKMWANATKETLELILHAPSSIRCHFENFIKDECNENHLAFFDDVDKLLRTEDSTQATDLATKICQQYIRPGSPDEINISHALKTAEYSSKDMKERLRAAQREILQMMALDTFPRFLRSTHCEAMIDAIAVYRKYKKVEDSPSASPASTISTQLASDPSSQSRDASSSSFTLTARSNSLPSALMKNLNFSKENIPVGNWLEYFKGFADLLPSCVVMADVAAPGAPLVFVNRQFCEVTGYEPAEILGRNCRFLQGPRSDPARVEDLRQAIRNGKVIHTEIINYRKNGEEFRNFLSMFPVFRSRNDKSRVLAYFIGIQFEVTSDALIPSKLIQHQALMKSLPRYVAL